jgi:hypothetical protein
MGLNGLVDGRVDLGLVRGLGGPVLVVGGLDGASGNPRFGLGAGEPGEYLQGFVLLERSPGPNGRGCAENQYCDNHGA